MAKIASTFVLNVDVREFQKRVDKKGEKVVFPFDVEIHPLRLEWAEQREEQY